MPAGRIKGPGGGEGGRAGTYVQSAQLGIWVLVVDAFFKRAHRLLWLNRLGADDIGYLKVEGDVLSIAGSGSDGCS